MRNVYILEGKDYNGNEMIHVYSSKESALNEMEVWAKDFQKDLQKECDDEIKINEFHDFSDHIRICNDSNWCWAECEVYGSVMD